MTEGAYARSRLRHPAARRRISSPGTSNKENGGCCEFVQFDEVEDFKVCLGWTIIHCCLWDDKLNYAFRSRCHEMLLMCEKTHDGRIQWVDSQIPAFA